MNSHPHFSLIFLLCLGCLGPSKSNNNPQSLPLPANYQPAYHLQKTFEGENRNPSFSSDGLKIVYASSHRKNHLNSQIYYKELQTQSEHRVTFQDGDTSWPVFFPGDHRILYASTTDEIKEHPKLINDFRRGYKESATTQKKQIYLEREGTELYSSTLKGQQIQRITFHKGIDSWPSPLNKKNRFVFSSQNLQGTHLFEVNSLGGGTLRLTKSKGNHLFGNISPDEQYLAWVSYDNIWYEAQIFLKNLKTNQTIGLLPQSVVLGRLSWHPSGKYLLFSGNIDDENNFEIYVYELATKCVQRLTFLKSQEIDPNFSPDGKQIIFSSNQIDRFQVYTMNFIPWDSCL